MLAPRPVRNPHPPPITPDPSETTCGPAGCGRDDGLQGSASIDRELWDAEAVCRHLVPAGSAFAFLADHRRDLFPAAEGWPSVPADVMAATIVLQKLHGLSDRDTAEAVRCDLR